MAGSASASEKGFGASAGNRPSLAGGSGRWLTLRGAKHMNFHDRALYTPLRSLTHAGPIQPLRAMEIINAYVLSFLQTHLGGRDEHLLDAPSARYPEIGFEQLSRDEP